MAALQERTARRLLTGSPVARLATVTAAGAPHLVPCCFAADGDRIYSVIDGKPKSTTALRRLDNVRANPAAALLVDHYDDDWNRLWWVRADGLAAVVGDEASDADADAGLERSAALALLSAKYHQYRADPPTGPLLRITVTAITGWAFDPDNAAPGPAR